MKIYWTKHITASRAAQINKQTEEELQRRIERYKKKKNIKILRKVS